MNKTSLGPIKAQNIKKIQYDIARTTQVSRDNSPIYGRKTNR